MHRFFLPNFYNKLSIVYKWIVYNFISVLYNYKDKLSYYINYCNISYFFETVRKPKLYPKPNPNKIEKTKPETKPNPKTIKKIIRYITFIGMLYWCNTSQIWLPIELINSCIIVNVFYYILYKLWVCAWVCLVFVWVFLK